jgi:dimethylhistidine N-methyltransferase
MSARQLRIDMQRGEAEVSDPGRTAAARELAEGLLAAAPYISPKFLYDPLGSRLFEAITELPEYYPTRTERGLLERHIGAIARAAGRGATLIELGAGNCEKASRLFDALQPAQYVAVDISAEFLQGALSALKRAHPRVEMIGVGADLTAGISLPDSVRRDRRLFVYLGSSIGNFDPGDAIALLREVRAQCTHNGGLLIGIDLVKSQDVLDAAYDDELGVTAAFNRNVLSSANSLLGSNFDVRDWSHRARFNAAQSRVEMHLEALRDVLVAWPGGSRHFRPRDRIHTENSYKYQLDGFKDLLGCAGFERVSAWTDDRQWFALCHASA